MILLSEDILKTFTAVFDVLADNIMVVDRQGVIDYVNPAYVSMTGYSMEESIGKTPWTKDCGCHPSEYYQRLWDTILSGKVFRSTSVNKKKNGDIYFADQTISPIFDSQGGIICFVSVWKDVTQLNVQDQNLKYELNKLEQVLSIEDGLHSIFNLDKLIDFVVEKTCKILEAEQCTIMFVEEETSKLCIKGHRGIRENEIWENALKLGDNMADLIEQHRLAELEEGQGCGVQEISKIDGTVYQSGSFLSVPLELKDHLMGIINVAHKRKEAGPCFSDLDLKILLMIVRQVGIAIDNARLYRQFKYLSMTDALTGLFNYRYLTQCLDYEILRANRYRRSLSLLMIDIDEFKNYNDAFGHVAGDELLRMVANCIKQSVRSADIVCRYAGDEFAVIFPETDMLQAKVIGEKIVKKILGIAAKKRISVSAGVVTGAIGVDRYELIKRADKHLYEAKRRGKNQIY